LPSGISEYLVNLLLKRHCTSILTSMIPPKMIQYPIISQINLNFKITSNNTKNIPLDSHCHEKMTKLQSCPPGVRPTLSHWSPGRSLDFAKIDVFLPNGNIVGQRAKTVSALRRIPARKI